MDATDVTEPIVPPGAIPDLERNRALARQRQAQRRRDGTRERWRRWDTTLYSVLRQLIGARHRAQFTQEQLAYRMGTTKSAISRFESGLVHRPTLTTIQNYATVLGCTVDIRIVQTFKLWED